MASGENNPGKTGFGGVSRCEIIQGLERQRQGSEHPGIHIHSQETASVSLSIASNLSSLKAQNHLTRASNAFAKSVERLSTGLRVNRGADGPASLVISEKQRAQIAGLQQALENSAKAVSLVQTAEGALGEVNDLLLKVRSLVLDSANAGVHDSETLAANQAEIRNALSTVDRIGANTQFGTKKLLDGSFGGRSVSHTDSDVTILGTTAETQAGTYSINVTSIGARAAIGRTFPPGGLTQDETLTINGADVHFTTGTTRQQFIDQINASTGSTGAVAVYDAVDDMVMIASDEWGAAATISIASDLAVPNAGSTGYSTTPSNWTGWAATVEINGESFVSTGTTTETANVIEITSGNAKGLKIALGSDPGDENLYTVFGPQGTVTVADNSLEFQIGANQNQTAKIGIARIAAASLGQGISGNQFNSLSEIDVLTSAGAQDAIAVVDRAIGQVTSQRAELGAFQKNTLISTSNNLRTALENTTAAESVIRDTDFAQEIANYTRNQVLVQAGVSILQNANQAPQMVLSLLR